MVAMTDRVKVTLTEKFADSKQPAQLAGAAGNPGEWAMLQLLHSGQEYQDRRTWIVPIDVQGTGKTFTLRLVIQLERPYPGPIPALPSAGGRPAMDAARQFLTPK